MKPNREDYIDVTDLHKLWMKAYKEPVGYSTSIEIRVHDKISGTMKVLILDPPTSMWGVLAAKIKELK